jgi:hypothetical protein
MLIINHRLRIDAFRSLNFFRQIATEPDLLCRRRTTSAITPTIIKIVRQGLTASTEDGSKIA